MSIVDFRARPNTPEYMAIYAGKAAERSWEIFDFPKPPSVPLESFVEALDANGIDVAVFTGRQGVQGWLDNDYIAECVQRFPDRIVGFGGIDPRREPMVEADIEHAVNELRLHGISLDPPDGADNVRGRGFDDERVMYPIYAKAAELGVPVVLTLGPLMTPFSNPVAIERIAADFPTLTIVCSHAGWPNVVEWIALAYRYKNVVIEPSIYIYLPGGNLIVEAANTILRDQIVYASAFPFNGIEVVRRFEALPFDDAVREHVMGGNARRILGLT
jgi:hypothetical protein